MPTLDTNDTKEATSVSATGKKRAAIYIFNETGTSKNHVVGLEVSPDGLAWMDVPHPVTGQGCEIYDILAVEVRPKVIETEGSISTITYHILLD